MKALSLHYKDLKSSSSRSFYVRSEAFTKRLSIAREQLFKRRVERYVQYRKERDIEMSLDEIEFWLELMEQEFKKGKLKKAKEILHKIPYNPDFALGIKKTQ